jgi:hypothetical protein
MSPEREIEASKKESEEEEVGGSMGDKNDGFMLQILKYPIKGQNEASQRQVETIRFQQ